MSKKKTYRVKNWPAYNAGLKKRGSITLWVNPHELKNSWKADSNKNPEDKRCIYSSSFIQVLILLKNVYCLAYRQGTGFFESILSLTNLNLPVPCYTTLCRRARKMKIDLAVAERLRQGEDLHLALDGSGLKVFGQGEWQTRTHGKSKRRTWVKIHIALDVNTKEIVCTKLTDSKTTDGSVLGDLLDGIDQKGKIGKVYGDGAYDQRQCYEHVKSKGGRSIFRMRKDAKLEYEKDGTLKDTERNQNLLEMKKKGLKAWKKDSTYHQRSLVENAFFRLKSVFPPKVYSRTFDRQEVETQVKCAILNRMIQIAQPISYVVP